MSPLFRSLFVFAAFSVIAAHVATDALAGIAMSIAPKGAMLLDTMLDRLFVGTLGPEVSVYVLLAVGAFCALWAYMSALAACQSRRQERYSTW